MILELVLIKRGEIDIPWSHRIVRAYEQQHDALVEKAIRLRNDKESKYDLNVDAYKCLDMNHATLLEPSPEKMDEYVDNWIKQCEKPRSCVSGKCRMGVVLK